MNDRDREGGETAHPQIHALSHTVHESWVSIATTVS